MSVRIGQETTTTLYYDRSTKGTHLYRVTQDGSYKPGEPIQNVYIGKGAFMDDAPSVIQVRIVAVE